MTASDSQPLHPQSSGSHPNLLALVYAHTPGGVLVGTRDFVPSPKSCTGCATIAGTRHAWYKIKRCKVLSRLRALLFWWWSRGPQSQAKYQMVSVNKIHPCSSARCAIPPAGSIAPTLAFCFWF